MNKKVQKFRIAFELMLIVSLLLNCFVANAAENILAVASTESTLGTQVPAITAVYTNEAGEEVDGNCLTSGTYTMNLLVNDLASISSMELTATYDESVVSFGEYTAFSGIDALEAIIQIENGSFIVGAISTNADCSALADNSATLLTIEILISADSSVDMANVISVNTDPDYTFIEVNYNDAQIIDGVYYYNCYALSTTETFSGTVYNMTCDLSPEITQGYSVSAYVGALATPADAYGTYATTGAVVSIPVGDSTITATTDNDGKFVLENVPNGEYVATISYKYGFERTFTIVVNGENIESTTMIGIVGCDWDEDKSVINTSDYSAYKTLTGLYSSDESYDLGVDINRDGVINTSDYKIFKNFSGLYSTDLNYSDIEIS